MGRYCYILSISVEGRAELESRFEETTDVRMRTRLGVLRATCEGRHTLDEVAELMGCSRGSVQNWVRAYEKGGLEAVMTRRKPGAATSPLQAPEVQAQFQTKLDQGAFRTAKQAQRWVGSRARLHPLRDRRRKHHAFLASHPPRKATSPKSSRAAPPSSRKGGGRSGEADVARDLQILHIR